MIELQDVTKVFNAGRPNEFTALSGVTLAIGKGELTVLKGPSGSGKTTLMGIIGCMARPTSGRVRLEGRELTSLPERFLTEIRRKTFGFVFQQFNLIRGITALENAMLPAYPLGLGHSTLRDKALERFARFGLSEEKALAKVEWLSGGEAQRVAIVRALINDPGIIIADEPTAHLDTRLSEDFLDIFRTLREDGKTIVVSSHDPLVYEAGIVDRVVTIRDGRTA